MIVGAYCSMTMDQRGGRRRVRDRAAYRPASRCTRDGYAGLQVRCGLFSPPASRSASARMSQARHAGRPGTELDTTRYRSARIPAHQAVTAHGNQCENLRKAEKAVDVWPLRLAADSIRRSSRRANDDQSARQENP